MTRRDITLVVPTYNGGPYLNDLLPLIKQQEGDFHSIIFIDDCSRDDSLGMVSGYGFKCPRIVKNDENLGLYGTINRAIALVDSAFVSLVFQDDLIFDNYGGAMQALTERRPDASFFVGRSVDVSPGGEIAPFPTTTGREWTKPKGPDSTFDVLLNGTSWIISASVSRTSTLRRYGFNAALPQCGDFDLFARAAREENFVYLDEVVAGIRAHPQQASTGNLRRSIDLIEKIGIITEQVRAWPEEFTFRRRSLLASRYLYYIARRAVGQLRRGRAGAAGATAALGFKLLAGLWPS